MPTDLPSGYDGQRRHERGDQLTSVQSAVVLLALVVILCGTVLAVVFMVTR